MAGGNLERQRGVTLRFLAEPGDVNFGGKVHGGAVMKWIDQVGYTCAAGWTAAYCVTVYVGDTDRALETYARRLAELRKQMDSEMERHLGALASRTRL
jgi:hypothetical protein